jgi:hypothetical protein
MDRFQLRSELVWVCRRALDVAQGTRLTSRQRRIFLARAALLADTVTRPGALQQPDLVSFLEARLDEAMRIRAKIPGAMRSPAMRSIPAQRAILARLRHEFTVWEDVARTLATVYAEHPDYDEAWRPR